MLRKLSKKLRKFSKRKTKPNQNNIIVHSGSTSVKEAKNAQCVNKQQYEGKLRLQYFSIEIFKYQACFRFRSHFKLILLLFGFNKFFF